MDIAAHKENDTIADDNVLQAFAQSYVNARGLGMEVLMALGGGGESLLRHLPRSVRDRIGSSIVSGMHGALKTARVTRRWTGRCPAAIERIIPGITGALGGAAGMPGAIAETPVAITLILRAILGEAEKAGYDPETEEAQRQALQVLAYAGPLDDDDGADFALVITKATVTGQTLSSVIRSVAPHVAVSISHKLAAQSVPVLGAVAGATINVLFTNYYREMARIHFSVLKLAKENAADADAIFADLRDKARKIRVARSVRRLP